MASGLEGDVWFTGQFNIPEQVLQAQQQGRLVLFVGAGASMAPPSSLPTFVALARSVATDVGEEATQQAEDAPDQFLTALEERGLPVHERIHRRVADSKEPNAVHNALVRLFPSLDEMRIVTTNYDRHLTTAADSVFGRRPAVYRAPALPLGRDFTGIVHLHGCLDQRPQDLVATLGDFGRAYLTDAWAARFLQDMFRTFTVLFVGYSHNDQIMRYLGRGLPPGTERFGLINDDTPPDWLAMGITAVTYPGADYHAALVTGLERWAELSRWGRLDHERQIADMVRTHDDARGSTDPVLPEDPAQLSYLERTVSQSETVVLFTRHATAPVWLAWASSQPVFASLFRPGPPLDDIGTTLSRWFAENFAVPYPDHAMAAVRQHGGLLHPETAGHVATALRNGAPTATVITSWVPALITSQASGVALSSLLGSLHWADHQDSILLLLDHLTTPRPQLIPPVSPSTTRFDIDTLTGDEHVLRRVWDGLRPHVGELSPRLLPGLERHLRTAYLATASSRGSAGFDSRSMQRSAIEPHEQDTFASWFDLLIDMARDCCEHLAATTASRVTSSFESWVCGDVPLLQRLAVHGWNARTDISADQKIRWLLDHHLLYSTAAKHEVFALLRAAVSEAHETRSNLLTRILAGPDTNNGSPEHDRLHAYMVFNLLTWVCQHDTSFTEAHQALREIHETHPDFASRRDPDLDVTIQGITFASPVTPEQLASMWSPADIDWLLNYQGESTTDTLATRGTLLATASQAAALAPSWGIHVADALAERDEWETDLWYCLIEGWLRVAGDLSQQESLQVLGTLQSLNARSAISQVRSLTVMFLLATPARLDAGSQVLDTCETLADALVAAGRQEPPAGGTELFSHWVSNLANFWVRSAVQRWNATEAEQRTGLTPASREALTALTDQQHSLHLTAIAALARQFRLLTVMDEDWVRAHLLPTFDWDTQPVAARVAWTGYLSRPGWDERVLELLRPSLLQRFTHATDEKLRPALINYLADLCLFSADAAQPANGVLTAFLSTSSSDDRKRWAEHIAWRLAKMDPTEAQGVWERWIKDYWERRLDHLPRVLEEEEVEQMLDWVLPSGQLLPAAVDLLTRSPSRFHGAFLFFRALEKSAVLTEHSEEASRLISHVLTHLEGPVAPCNEIGSAIRTLAHAGGTDLTPELRQACSGAAQAGCSDALAWADGLPT